MSISESFTSPVGRIVGGDVWEPQTKDLEGRPLTDRQGQPRENYFIALAIAKDNPEWPAFRDLLHNVAKGSFPNLFNEQGQPLRPDFAFKYKDGDSTVPNQRNVRPCDREGYPGHWIVSFNNGYAPEVFDTVVQGQPVSKIIEPSRVRRGYYVRVAGNAKGNDNLSKPGIYVNFTLVEFVGFGQVIETGANASEVFGQKAAYVPPGMSTTPVAGTAKLDPNSADGIPFGEPINRPAAMPPAQNFASKPIQGATGFSNGPMPPQVPSAPVPSGPKMTPKANGVPYESFIQQGWTDDQMRSEGYLI